MPGHLALDLSKASTGWAVWRDGWAAPRFGNWRLGSEYTSNGGVFFKLNRCLTDLFKVERFDNIYFEEAINPGQLTGHTTIQTINLAIGLAAHVESFGHARRLRLIKAVNVERWRKDYIGDMVVRELKADVRRRRKHGDTRASSRDQLKRLTMERCRQFGLLPRTNDQADAIGILTYSLLLGGITPPWVADEVLREPLNVEAGR